MKTGLGEQSCLSMRAHPIGIKWTAAFVVEEDDEGGDDRGTEEITE